jgi:MFS family permease
MVSVAALIPAPGLAWLFVLLAVLGTSLAFFWPAIQASLADLAGRGAVTGNLGWFNIAWSAGKSVGFLVGGAILAGVGFGALFAAAALAMLAVVLLLRAVRIGGGADEHKARESIQAPRLLPRNAGRYRLAAWIANAIAFGVVSVLNLQYPDWLERMGRPETLFGAYLGLIFASQTVAFALLSRYSGWQYRAAPLLMGQVPVIAVLLALPHLRAPALILATAPLVGAGLGMTYFASLFYSVAEAGSRGRNAGVHEAVLGIGSLVVPILGGIAAKATGRPEAPYLFAGVAAMIALAVQGVLLRSPAGTGTGAARQG